MGKTYVPEIFISPEWDAALRAALWESVRMELVEVDKLDEAPEEAFTLHYHHRKEKTIPMAERRYSSFGKRTIRRAALIAAILTLVLAASAAVIAITVPQIRYIIFKNNISWDILFNQEDPNNVADQEFQAIKPVFPEGYEVVQEELIPGSYFVMALDDQGNRIIYTQLDANAAGVTIDSESDEIREEIINGQKFIVQQDGTILFNNGYYVFKIDGDCEIDLLLEMGKSILSQM